MEEVIVNLLSKKLRVSYHEALAMVRAKVSSGSAIEMAKYAGVIATAPKSKLINIFNRG